MNNQHAGSLLAVFLQFAGLSLAILPSSGWFQSAQGRMGGSL
jgi:hypothetical protein